AWKKLVGAGDKAGEIDTLLQSQPEEARTLKETLMRLRHGLNAQNKEQTSRAWAGLMTQLAALRNQDEHQARNLIEAVFGTRGAEEVTTGALAAMGAAIADPKAIIGDYEGSLQTAFDRKQTWLDEMHGAGTRFFGALVHPVQEFIEMLAPVGDQMVALTHAITDLVEEVPVLAEAIVGLTLAIGAAKAVSLTKKGLDFVRGVDPSVAAKKKPGLTKKLVTGAGNHLKTGAAAAAGAAAMASKSVASRIAPMIARGAATFALGSTPLGWAITGIGTAAWLGYEYWPQISNTLKDLRGESEEQNKRQPEPPKPAPPKPAVQVGNITFSPTIQVTPSQTGTQPELREQMLNLLREQQTDFVLEMRNLLEAVQSQQDQALYAR
ncbi:MAG: hypothetical protein AAF669_09160, partial [Pseudomonadota bacterium]